MKLSTALFFALALTGCAQQSVSQSVIVRPLFNDTTVGWPDYPIIIEGAGSVGSNPVAIAQNLRFPAGLRADSSFRAVAPGDALPPTHAHLLIQPGQPLASSTLTFVHGPRRIGVGTFAIPPGAYRDPQALGSASATLISDMLNESRENERNDRSGQRLF